MKTINNAQGVFRQLNFFCLSKSLRSYKYCFFRLQTELKEWTAKVYHCWRSFIWTDLVSSLKIKAWKSNSASTIFSAETIFFSLLHCCTMAIAKGHKNEYKFVAYLILDVNHI